MTDDIYDRGILVSVWDDWQRRWSEHDLPTPPDNWDWPKFVRPKKKKKPSKRRYIRKAETDRDAFGLRDWLRKHEEPEKPITDYKGNPPVRMVQVGRGLWKFED